MEAEHCIKQISLISLDHHLWVYNQLEEAMCILETCFVNLQNVVCFLLLLFFFSLLFDFYLCIKDMLDVGEVDSM